MVSLSIIPHITITRNEQIYINVQPYLNYLFHHQLIH